MLQDLKNYLKITWDNEDDYLNKIISRGQAAIEDLVGSEVDFENNEPAKTLLLDYGRYYYNNAVEYFEENFISQIVRLRVSL